MALVAEIWYYLLTSHWTRKQREIGLETRLGYNPPGPSPSDPLPAVRPSCYKFCNFPADAMCQCREPSESLLISLAVRAALVLSSSPVLYAALSTSGQWPNTPCHRPHAMLSWNFQSNWFCYFWILSSLKFLGHRQTITRLSASMWHKWHLVPLSIENVSVYNFMSLATFLLMFWSPEFPTRVAH